MPQLYPFATFTFRFVVEFTKEFGGVSFLMGLDNKIMQVCEDITGPRSWEFFQGLLVSHEA
jgi:hypothetical protein